MTLQSTESFLTMTDPDLEDDSDDLYDVSEQEENEEEYF
jgi:hypothetical protein